VAVSKKRSKVRPAEPVVDAALLHELYQALPTSDAASDPTNEIFATTATLLIRSARVISARVDEVVAPLGLTVPKFEVLGFLIGTPDGEMSFAELKRRMFMHPATMGHTIRLLEADGLVKRRAHETDRRAYVAVLTAKGRTAARKGLDALREIGFGCEGLSVPAAKAISSRLTALG
jgi:DNA-binding MarR family transcriptional regulator